MAKKGHKRDWLAELADEREPMIIFITESHLDHSHEDGEVDMPGYRVLRQDRDPKRSKKKKGGGALAYVREDELAAEWEKAWEQIKREQAPLRRIKIGKKRKKAGWFNKDIKSSIERRVAKDRAMREATDEDAKQAAKAELKAAKSEAKKKMFAAKKTYWMKKITALGNSGLTERKEGHAIWNELMGRKKKCRAQPWCTADEMLAACTRK
eukprot:gene11196-28427_t